MAVVPKNSRSRDVPAANVPAADVHAADIPAQDDQSPPNELQREFEQLQERFHRTTTALASALTVTLALPFVLDKWGTDFCSCTPHLSANSATLLATNCGPPSLLMILGTPNWAMSWMKVRMMAGNVESFPKTYKAG